MDNINLFWNRLLEEKRLNLEEIIIKSIENLLNSIPMFY